MSSAEDKWEKALEEQTALLKACQKAHGHKSCLPCEKLNDCELRDNYVTAVYESMSKGQGGGFEF